MTQLQHNSKDFQVRKTEEFQLNNKLIDLQSFTLLQKTAPKKYSNVLLTSLLRIVLGD